MAHHKLLLSVIIPTFGRQVLTEMAIRSVLNQKDIDDFELIIVDDGSKPAIVLPSQLSDSRVRIVRHEENRGAAAARNTGVDNSTGEWISFLDSDDRLLENTLARRLAFARQNSGHQKVPIVYCCGFSHFTDNAHDLRTRIPGSASTPEEFASGCWFCPGSTALMRRSTMVDIGPQAEELRRLEDYDWFLRFGLKGGKLIVQPLIGALIRSSGAAIEDLIQDATTKLRRKWLVGHWQLSAKAARNIRAYLRLERGVSALRQGSKLNAAVHLTSSLLLVPRFTPQLSPAPQLMH